jgi:hypothetical protein
LRRVDCSCGIRATYNYRRADAVHGRGVELRDDATAQEESLTVPQAAVCNDGKAGRACSAEYVRSAKDIRQIFSPFSPYDLVADPSQQALADRS